MTHARKALMKFQELTQKKSDEPVQIPKHLKDFWKVFSKKQAAEFPPSRKWDHAIKLKSDFVPQDCQVYKLTPKEEKAMDKFIDKNLAKGYI